MTLEAQAQALLDLIEADRVKKCDAIEREAKTRAEATLAAARAEARDRVRTVFVEERERLEARLAAARARLQTHRRLHEQRRALALLAAGWQRLPGVLAERWRDSSSRRSWVESVLTQARAALRPAQWRIVHAANWPEGERNELIAALAKEHGEPPHVELDATAQAGLWIGSGANRVDGTLAGLIADRSEVGAMLLQRLEAEA